MLLEYFVCIVLIHRLSSLSIIILLWTWLHKRLGFVINWPTYNIDTITLSRHNKITRISLKCIPYPSIIILILWYHIRIRKCLKLCLLIPWVVTRSCHMSTCQVVVFICTWFHKMVVCWLELLLDGGLGEKCWSSWCVAMCNLFCYVFINC